MTLETRVQSALSAHPDDKRLRLLASGYQDAWKACVAERSGANLKALKTWESELSEYLDGLPDAPGQEPRELPDPLRNYNQVRRYMIELGYSCSASQPERAEERGELKRRKGRGFTKAEVRRYALAKYGQPIREGQSLDAPVVPADQDQSLAEELLREKIGNQRLDREKKELALERERGNLVPAADLAITLASFGAVVENELKNHLRALAKKVVTACGGDAARKSIVARMMTDCVDQALRHAAEIEEYRVQFESLGGKAE